MTTKSRILKSRGNPNCDKHDWEEPWPMAELSEENLNHEPRNRR
jgi:hypothetical protein